MDFFYVGSIALNYWTLKYYNKKIKETSDVDISSTELSLSELERKYPKYDTVPLLNNDNYNIFTFGNFNNDGIYIEDEDVKYATPEYLVMTYYARMDRTHFTGKKFMPDIFKVKYLKEIIKARGYLDEMILNLKKLNYDYRIFFAKNNYVYRIMFLKDSSTIIGGEFALLLHCEMNGLIYDIQNLDIHLYNITYDDLLSIHGSKIINHKNSIPYIDYDGLKIQTLESIQELYPNLNIPDELKEKI